MSAWRTVRRCTWCRSANSRMLSPSSRCWRRILSNSSTLDNSFSLAPTVWQPRSVGAGARGWGHLWPSLRPLLGPDQAVIPRGRASRGSPRRWRVSEGLCGCAAAPPAGSRSTARVASRCLTCKVRSWQRAFPAGRAGDSKGEEGRMPMPTLTAPKLVSSRDQARELTESLPADLTGAVVVVDCAALQASTPSFVDELVKVVLVERNAKLLRLVSAREPTAELARRAAAVRQVADRLRIDQAPSVVSEGAG